MQLQDHCLNISPKTGGDEGVTLRELMLGTIARGCTLTVAAYCGPAAHGLPSLQDQVFGLACAEVRSGTDPGHSGSKGLCFC